MQVTANNPIALEFNRDGGCIVTGRLDFWRAEPQGWQLAGSAIFQQVTESREVKEIRLPGGSYTAVFKCRAEESINGVYSVELALNGIHVGSRQGDVDTTSSSHDSAEFKNQFVLDVA